MYRKGTCILQEPDSAPQCITEKPMEIYHLDEWFVIMLCVAGLLQPAVFQ